MKSIKIYGERNCGTRYFEQLIKKNFSVNFLPSAVPNWCRILSRLLYFREQVVDLYFSFTFSENLGWKHSKADIDKIFEAISNSTGLQTDLHFITVTKNPYSWLLSMYKNPYHNYKYKKYKHIKDLVKTRWEVDEPFEAFIQSPWKSLGRDNCNLSSFDNLMELWNIKNRSYKNLKQQDLSCINLRYEDLVINPEQVFQIIADEFELELKPGGFENYSQSTKNESKKFKDYQDYYRNEKWKSKYNNQLISIVNGYIDEELLEYFGYNKIKLS